VSVCPSVCLRAAVAAAPKTRHLLVVQFDKTKQMVDFITVLVRSTG